MSDEGARQDTNPIAPFQSAVVGEGVTWLAVTTTPAIYDMLAYPGLFGRLIALLAYGDTIWFSTSSDGLTAIDPALAAGVSLEAGTSKVRPVPIGHGFSAMVRLVRERNRYLHVRSATLNASLIIYPASQPRGADL
jgi:hypothetical protein